MKTSIVTAIAIVLIVGCGVQSAEEQTQTDSAAEATDLELTPLKPVAKAPSQNRNRNPPSRKPSQPSGRR